MLGLGFKTLPRTCTRIFFKPTNHLFVWFCKDFFLFFSFLRTGKTEFLKQKKYFFFLSENRISQNRNNRILKTKEIFFFFLSENRIQIFFLKTRSSFFSKKKKKNRISQNLKNKFLFFSFTTKPNTNNKFPFFPFASKPITNFLWS